MMSDFIPTTLTQTEVNGKYPILCVTQRHAPSKSVTTPLLPSRTVGNMLTACTFTMLKEYCGTCGKCLNVKATVYQAGS